MKKLLTIFLLIISINSIGQDGVFSRVIAKQSLFVKDNWVDSLKRDTMNLQNDNRTLMTSGAVYKFVAGRMSGGGGSSSITLNNSVYVAKNGNDATGLRNRLDKPFLTIWAAKAAALSGDAVVVFPGTYDEIHPLLLNNNINYYFIGSGEVTLTTSLSTESIFKDSSTVTTSFIFAPGWNFTARSSQKVVNLTIPESRLTMTFNQATSISSHTIFADDDTWIKLTGHRAYSTNRNAIYLIEDTSYVDVDIIESDNREALYLQYPYYTIIHAKEIKTNDTVLEFYAINMAGSDSSAKIYIRSDLIKGGNGWAVYGYGDSQDAYVEAQLITDSSDCVVVSSQNINLRVRADIIETITTGSIDAIINNEGNGGVFTVSGARVLRPNSTSGNDVMAFSNGQVYLNSVVYDNTKVSESPSGLIRRVDTVFRSSIYIADKIYNPGITAGAGTKAVRVNPSTGLYTYVDTTSAGGGLTIGTTTITSGTNKYALYNNAGVLGNYAGLQIGNTNNNVLMTAQATTDVPLNIKAASSQTANLLNVSSSSGTGDLASIDKNGAITTATLSAQQIVVAGTGGILTGDNNFTYNTASVNVFSIVGNNSSRSSTYVRNTNSGGNTSSYWDNDRGSLSTYAGFLVGGSADAGGNLFGVARADGAFLIADGATSNGLAIGTLTADALILGTNNTNAINISSAQVITMSNLAGTGSRAVLADASGVLSAPVSDRSVKKNIQSLDYGINELMKLRPVSFEYKDGWKNYGQGKQIGFIAQDIQKVLPNSVFTTPSTGKMGYQEIDLIPLLTSALQQSIIRIENLEKEVKRLKRK